MARSELGRRIELKRGQSRNAEPPIVTSESDTMTPVSWGQSRNASSKMFARGAFSCTAVRAREPAKAPTPSEVSVVGVATLVSPVPAKAPSPIIVTVLGVGKNT